MREANLRVRGLIHAFLGDFHSLKAQVSQLSGRRFPLDPPDSKPDEHSLATLSSDLRDAPGQPNFLFDARELNMRKWCPAMHGPYPEDNFA